MATTEFFHGTRVFKVGQTQRPVEVQDYSTLGTVMIAPAADPDVFPLDTPVTVFTNDTVARAAAGTGGNVDAIFDAIDDQGIVAELQVIRVAEGTSEVPQTKLEQTIANIVGSGANNSGVHAFKEASKPAKLIFVPGYDSQRISNAKNPVAAELEGICNRLRAIKILNTPDASKEAAELYRSDFADDPRAYLFHPSVKVFRTTTVIEPASGRVAGLFVKRDKEIGGPYESPSNQSMGGTQGPSRPIPYFDGEPDSEANYLNKIRIATLRGGSILWGNRTCAADPLDTFVNVVRTQDMIDDTVMRAFYWAIDRNQSVPLTQAILQTLDDFGDELVGKGGVLGFRPWFDRSLNTNGALGGGILRIDYDREPAAPLEDLQFGAHRNLEYYATLADGIINISSNITAR
ncbi:phage tail sheath C-terminal domain-containing protein [Bosea sp. 2KB_26]|uniref:phage tail sheath C-terminal domain-containing protein n=1 Tax=Bosea sp. 2KB_26 TaxID=3237475 RepID=UPI003F92BAE0